MAREMVAWKGLPRREAQWGLQIRAPSCLWAWLTDPSFQHPQGKEEESPGGRKPLLCGCSPLLTFPSHHPDQDPCQISEHVSHQFQAGSSAPWLP